MAFWTRFVTIRSRSAAEPTVCVVFAGDVERDPALFGEVKQRFGGFFGDEGEVDGLAGEAPAVGAAEQQKCLGEVDRPRVDSVEAFDEVALVARGVVAGDVEECLRDGQRGAQFVGGVGGESLLFGDVGFELFEHGVEHVGEFAEFVVGSFHADPVRQRSVRGHPCRVCDPCEWCEHPAGQDPSSQEAEHEEEGHCCRRGGGEGMQEVGAVGPGGAGAVRYVAQQEHPDHGQQESTGEEEKSGVADGEFQSGAEPWASIHEYCQGGRGPCRCRFGSRRREPWR